MTVRGTVEEIYEKLLAVKSVISTKKNEGWKLFQNDETWKYETKNDDRVCRQCNEFAGDWIGSNVPTEFSSYARWGKNHIKPGTHIYYPELIWSHDPDSYGGCRCSLFWYDYVYVLTNRLWREMEEATI